MCVPTSPPASPPAGGGCSARLKDVDGVLCSIRENIADALSDSSQARVGMLGRGDPSAIALLREQKQKIGDLYDGQISILQVFKTTRMLRDVWQDRDVATPIRDLQQEKREAIAMFNQLIAQEEKILKKQKK